MTATNLAGSDEPAVGRWVPGYDVPVVNERAVRAAAGILLLGGGIAWGLALSSGSTRPLQPFGLFFMIDMLLRVAVALMRVGHAMKRTFLRLAR